ncbi:hypothetical protein LPJ64_002098 [Coemansia asiatica]|uniref:EF-hand domain-containing protein n=1 Tax=Coemansia asiatica TaxID=1052880 RepID=A0A9W7XM78_9FUNG|nr:hypothetical protein LPJ64_002098 [Coemansia asiatica]KAJ2874062.1 hypothetical protein FB639_004142 [Coemansia asiatica]
MPAELLQDDMEFTAECEAALVEIFSRYDEDKDGALNEQEIQSFAKENDGALLMSGFIQLYSLQTNAGDEEETWNDLKKHGYNDKLELAKKNEDADKSDETT